MKVILKIKSHISNILTLFRIFLVPPFIVFVFRKSIISGFISLLLFIIAAISDYFDGYFARKWNIRTPIGEFMDPLADKILVCGAFVAFMLLPDFYIPAWIVAIILFRELLLTVLRVVAIKRERPIVTEFSGKIKTAFQMFSIVCLLMLLAIKKALLYRNPELIGDNSIGLWTGLFGDTLGAFLYYFPLLLVSLSASLALFSMFHYIAKNYEKTGFRFLVKLLATGFFTGYIPFAPGTFGAILGAIIWILVSKSFYYYIAVFIIVISGFFISGYAEKNIFLKKDSSKIVIDEISGILIAFITFQFELTISGITYLIFGFILFRFFDIVKPPPIRKAQRIRGGTGIMLDDVFCGVITNAVLQVLRILLFSA